MLGRRLHFRFHDLELVETLPTPAVSCIVSDNYNNLFVAAYVGQVNSANRWLLRDACDFGFEPYWLASLRSGKTSLSCVFGNCIVGVIDDSNVNASSGSVVLSARLPRSYFDALVG